MFEEKIKQTNKQSTTSSHTKVRKRKEKKSRAHKKHTSLQYWLLGSANQFDEAVGFLVTVPKFNCISTAPAVK